MSGEDIESIVKFYIKKGYDIDDIAIVFSKGEDDSFKKKLYKALTLLIKKIEIKNTELVNKCMLNIKRNKVKIDSLKIYGDFNEELNDIWVKIMGLEEKIVEELLNNVKMIDDDLTKNAVSSNIKLSQNICIKLLTTEDRLKKILEKLRDQNWRLNSYKKYAEKYLNKNFITYNNIPKDLVKNCEDLEKHLTNAIIYELENICYNLPIKYRENITEYGSKIKFILAKLICKKMGLD